MEAPPSEPGPAVSPPACGRHADQPSVGTCERCGTFVCARDVRLLDDRCYCEACAAREDVDWLGAWARRQHGRREGWAGVFGVLALANLGLALVLAARPPDPWTEGLGFFLGAGVNTVTCALWFAGRPAARRAIFLGPALLLAFGLVFKSVLEAVLAVLCLLVAWVARRDVRSRLFFRLEVPRPELQRYYRLHHDNPAARMALQVAVLGLVFPVVGVAALGLGVTGLLRVDPKATPPVGRRAHAIAAVLLGAAELVFLVLVYLPRMR